MAGNKPFLMLVFAMGAYGICGIPLWNGYVSKTLLHESIVEYIEVLGAQGADALPFQVLEWAFLLAGGLTVATWQSCLRPFFWKRPQWAGRGMTGKSGTPARLPALPWAALLVSSSYGDGPPPDYGPYGRYQPSVFKGGTGHAPGGVFFRGQSQGSLYQHINRNSGVCAVHPQIPYGDRGGRDQGLCGQMAGMAEPGGPGLPPPGTCRAAFLGAVLARCVNGICEGPLPLFMKRPEKNQVVAPGESSRFFRQAQDVRLLHMIYSSMGYGFMMLGAGLILMTAYVLFL